MSRIFNNAMKCLAFAGLICGSLASCSPMSRRRYQALSDEEKEYNYAHLDQGGGKLFRRDIEFVISLQDKNIKLSEKKEKVNKKKEKAEKVKKIEKKQVEDSDDIYADLGDEYK